jgi:hypothetical protein
LYGGRSVDGRDTPGHDGEREGRLGQSFSLFCLSWRLMGRDLAHRILPCFAWKVVGHRAKPGDDTEGAVMTPGDR